MMPRDVQDSRLIVMILVAYTLNTYDVSLINYKLLFLHNFTYIFCADVLSIFIGGVVLVHNKILSCD